MALHAQTTTIAGLLGITLLASGCPDSQARFDEFLDATKDHRPSGEDEGDGDGAGSLVDMNGTFLFALETTLGPGLPLQFATTVSNMQIAEDGSSATADFSFQPLSLDPMEVTTPREFVGEPLEFPGVSFDAEGNYEIDMGTVMVPGAANPVSGGDIVAALTVSGQIVHRDAFCGSLAGDASSPIVFGLDGSTFAAIRLADDGSDPATLPLMFPYECETVPPRILPDMTGTYLFALETTLGPGLPLQFATTVEFNINDDGSVTGDFSFQPLSLDPLEVTTPREFVGEPLEFDDVPFDAAGNYEIDMGTVMVPGAANPVSGGEIVATLQVAGSIVHVDAFCGELTGDLSSPVIFDIDGSTFAAIRLADDGSDPTTLPLEFPFECSTVPPAGG